MATCKCGKSVGCGCNLNKEGLCAECAKKKRDAEKAAAEAAKLQQ
jgi:hypothetical protein